MYLRPFHSSFAAKSPGNTAVMEQSPSSPFAEAGTSPELLSEVRNDVPCALANRSSLQDKYLSALYSQRSDAVGISLPVDLPSVDGRRRPHSQHR